MPRCVPFFLVFFQNGPSRDFFSSLSIASTFFGALFDVFVLALLFGADAFQMLLSRHKCSLESGWRQAKGQTNTCDELVQNTEALWRRLDLMWTTMEIRAWAKCRRRLKVLAPPNSPDAT